MPNLTRNYGDRLDRLIARRTAPVAMKKSMALATAAEADSYQASPIYEVYNQIQQDGKAVKYAVGAMQQVDPKYTEVTYGEGDRIKNQLSKAFAKQGIGCDFEYQGSVPCNLHIKSYSDIDLLAITDRFVTLEPPQKPSRPYDGNPVDDLRDIRVSSAACLRDSFPAATVDDSGAKSISVEGGSLQRKVDIVPANWFDTNAYAASSAKRDRAIQILDHKSGRRIKNQPFLHAYKIDQKDKSVTGGLRKVIRLMKSLRYDSEGSVRMSSYDIAGIGYGMSDYQLSVTAERQVALLMRLKEHLDYLAVNSDARERLLVPDQSRPVFCLGHATIDDLEALRDEVDDLVEAVAKDLNRSFENLAEARVSFKPPQQWPRPPQFDVPPIGTRIINRPR